MTSPAEPTFETEQDVVERIVREQFGSGSGPKAERVSYPARSARDIIENTPQVDWLINRVLPGASVGMLFGPSNSFKTFVALDASLSLAAGIPWHGHEVARAAALYVSGEGALRNRLDGWCRARGVHPGDAALWAVQMPVPMDTPAAAAEIAESFDRQCSSSGLKPGLIVLDTLSRMLSLGGDRNPDAVAPFIQHCDYLRSKLGASVLIVHHTGHADDSRPRGMSDLPGAMDFAYSVSGNLAGMTSELRPFKMKEAEPPPPLAFRMRLIELPGIVDNFGRQASTLVPELTALSQGRPAATPTGRWQSAVCEVLRLAHGSALGLEQIIEDARRAGLAKGEPGFRIREGVGRALAGLERSGLIVREGETFRLAGRQADLGDG